MMKRLVYIIFITIISFIPSNNVFSQDTTSTIIVNRQDSTIKSYLNNFDGMHISYYGSTQKCEAYNVYAMKYRTRWILYVTMNDNMSTMLINPPIQDRKIDYPSKYLIEGITHSYALKYTKLKKRKRDVLDMKVYGFYKFNRFGRKVVKGLLFLEYPFFRKGLLSWKLDPKKLTELVKKKIEEEIVPPQIEAVKKEIETVKMGIKEIKTDIGTEIKDLKTEVDESIPVKKE